MHRHRRFGHGARPHFGIYGVGPEKESRKMHQMEPTPSPRPRSGAHPEPEARAWTDRWNREFSSSRNGTYPDSAAVFFLAHKAPASCMKLCNRLGGRAEHSQQLREGSARCHTHCAVGCWLHARPAALHLYDRPSNSSTGILGWLDATATRVFLPFSADAVTDLCSCSGGDRLRLPISRAAPVEPGNGSQPPSQ